MLEFVSEISATMSTNFLLKSRDTALINYNKTFEDKGLLRNNPLIES